MGLIWLLACAATPADVCAAQLDAIEACEEDWTTDPECEGNLEGCADEDLGRWETWYNCLGAGCRGGQEAADASEDCADQLEGVSWGCSPSGAVI
jgi:hypothetical protein